MSMAEKRDCTYVTYTLELWAPGRLESGLFDSGSSVLGQMEAWSIKSNTIYKIFILIKISSIFI